MRKPTPTDDEVRLARAESGHASGRRIKNHDGISSDAWCSPPEIASPLLDLYGRPVGCDPCSNERSIIQARRRLTTGGLVLPWGHGADDDDAYANWPYSQNVPWAGKALHELATGRIVELVILCMTATSTTWWRRLMLYPKRNPRVILTKRIKFLGPNGKPVDSSRFEPALIYYGWNNRRFDKTFAHLAMWSTWGR